MRLTVPYTTAVFNVSSVKTFKDLISVLAKVSFSLIKIFLINLSQEQYGLIHITHLEKFDQFLLKAHTFRSMLYFAIFLANSDQETIRFDPYCPYKGSVKFHQRLILSFFLFQIYLRNIF